MASFNRVVLVGNLTRDPQLKYLPNGTAVAEVSLATNRKWKDSGGQKKTEVTYTDCNLWGRTAEVAAQYLRKGSQVLFEGRLSQDSWTDKTTGDKRTKTYVTVESMTMLGSPRQSDQRPASDSFGEESQAAPVVCGDDDVPF